jgi:predicted DCC family thiol-disulfide oxidoreductase YuxK
MGTIVLYDGDCGFCRWMVAWALERDRDHVLTVAPIQSPTGERLLADLEPAERLRSVHVVHDDGRRTSGGAAVREVLGVLPAARRFAPLGGAEWAYRLVAAQRGRISRLVPAKSKARADELLERRRRDSVPTRK